MQNWLIPGLITSSHCMWLWGMLVKTQRPKLSIIVGMLVLFLVPLLVLQQLLVDTLCIAYLFSCVSCTKIKLRWYCCIIYKQGHVLLLGEKEHNADFEGSNLQRKKEKGEFLTFDGFSSPSMKSNSYIYSISCYA